MTKNAPAILNSATLPLRGTHLIEASAGTGKTYNIVRLYLRLLIERQLPVDQILVMTFTKAATAEIRNRLNEFLREALATWETNTEEVFQNLRNSVDQHVAKLLLQQAILKLDEAAIYTIHGFCKRALSQQAFLSGVSFNANMEAESLSLLKQASEDWYRTVQNEDWFDDIYERWQTPEDFVSHWKPILLNDETILPAEIHETDKLSDQFRLAWQEERAIYTKLNKAKANSNPNTVADYHEVLAWLDAHIEGTALPTLTKTQLKNCFGSAGKRKGMPVTCELVNAQFNNQLAHKTNAALTGVTFIRQRVKAFKDQLDQLDFNDLIIQLRDALQGEQRDALRASLFEQFPVALVDEFQDTDPDQYQIFQSLYTKTDQHFLCMIGDPKQSIYGFRGGDVFAYLGAKQNADYCWTMNTNFRSSPSVIEGYNRIFLNEEPECNTQLFNFNIDYLRVAASNLKQDADFSDDRAAVQWVHIEPTEPKKKGESKAFQESIADWVSEEIVHLLSKTTCDGEPINAGDIALLVRGYDEAQRLQSALAVAGLPSVYLSNRENIFQTIEAFDLLALLHGIWHLENDRQFVTALASSWLGQSPMALDTLQNDEHLWSQWQNQFEHWRMDWQQRGLMSLLLDVLQNHSPINTEDERSLTNRLHLAERLQIESSRLRRPDALLHWFHQALHDDAQAEENILRLESDESLIKILTMHGSKGLEYPIVFLPFVSYRSKSNKAPAAYRYHDRTTLSVKLAFLANDDQKRWQQEEENAELIRLFYVAATRAEKRLYICSAQFSTFKESALGLTLQLDDYTIEALQDRVSAGEASALMSVKEANVAPEFWSPENKSHSAGPATFHGHIERNWWLSSFSSLTRNIGHASHSEPDRDSDSDGEGAITEDIVDDSLRFRLAKGAEAGNLLHDALEHCDFTAPDYDSMNTSASERYSSLAETYTPQELSTWIDEILHAPILTFSLSELALQNTLRESEFYFPMHGAPLSRLATFISKRRQQLYQLPEHQILKGMMHGFIDLIFEYDGKYFVADYKSTHLGHRLSDYNTQALTQSVYDHHYDVQYTLYSLALHRYLKARLPNYTPEEHFGGVVYLYLRGMSTSSNTGIYFDRFTSEELDFLDALFQSSEDLSA